MVTSLCLKDSANNQLQGPIDPSGRLHPWWARLAYPLAGNSQRPFQTNDRWGFIQIPNSLLDFDFPTIFY
jgi:hypothetical protein